MKKLLLPFAIALLAQQTLSAETFRVNNTPGSGAQYTTFDDAQKAASDGDVIIVDGSATSYGKIVVTKKITLKGPGYFLDQDESMNEAANPAKFEEIKVQAEGVTLTGLYITDDINLLNNNIVVTRCNVPTIYLSKQYPKSENAISNCIIHQNFIKYSIRSEYSNALKSTYFQITENIISCGHNAMFYRLDHATISRNTICPKYGLATPELSNCVFENNICPDLTNSATTANGNTYNNNLFLNSTPYSDINYNSTDREVKAIDETLTTTQGAFSGNDPYVLSGLPSGPMIQDVIMPESVAKGENLKVTVKIGSSK